MRILDKVVEGVSYFKFRINLPVKMVKELELEGKPLKVTKQGKKIIIEKE